MQRENVSIINKLRVFNFFFNACSPYKYYHCFYIKFIFLLTFDTNTSPRKFSIDEQTERPWYLRKPRRLTDFQFGGTGFQFISTGIKFDTTGVKKYEKWVSVTSLANATSQCHTQFTACSEIEKQIVTITIWWKNWRSLILLVSFLFSFCVYYRFKATSTPFTAIFLYD